jgi:BirA family biotin operon repressor/biotin-[acetyl-CoA-carboxylase] ligase
LVRLLRLLADGRIHGGPALARELGVSRAAVWKQIEHLRREQVPVEAVAGRGYRLPIPVELLDAPAIRSALDRQGLAPDLAVEVALSCASTNRALLQQAGEVAQPTALLAEAQHGGRGRWGRVWQSPFGGGLYLSLLWRLPAIPTGLGGLSLACGMAVAEALRGLGAQGLGLKWPNDLVCEAGKLGGILVELAGEPSGPCQVVIGLGLNVRLSSALRANVGQPAADLYAFLGEAALRRNELAALCIAALVRACEQFAMGGFASFQARWPEFDVFARRRVILHLPAGSVEGEVCGVDERGALCLLTDQGVMSYFSGDVELKLRYDLSN